MRIAMIGTGYVGLVSGACFADFGHQVTCVDKDAGKIDALNAGKMPIWEPGLEALVKANAEHGRLQLHHRPRRAASRARRRCSSRSARRRGAATAMPTSLMSTPRCASWPQADRAGNGGGDQVDRAGRHRRPDRRDPRRGRASKASRSRPTRNSCAKARRSATSRSPTGSSSAPRTSMRAKCCARSTGRCSSTRRRSCSPARRTAELTKYAANAFLAVKISFINEIADLCEAVGADVQDVARGIGLDNRIGAKFLHAGPGYGGSCFPKDTLALLQTAEAAGVDQRIVRTVVEVNDDAQGERWRRGSRDALGGNVAGQAHRGARPRLQAQHRRHARGAVAPADRGPAGGRGASVAAFDPVARRAGRAACCNDVEFAARRLCRGRGCRRAVIVTEWDEFRALDLEKLAAAMRGKVLVDLAQCLRPEAEARRPAVFRHRPRRCGRLTWPTWSQARPGSLASTSRGRSCRGAIRSSGSTISIPITIPG